MIITSPNQSYLASPPISPPKGVVSPTTKKSSRSRRTPETSVVGSSVVSPKERKTRKQSLQQKYQKQHPIVNVIRRSTDSCPTSSSSHPVQQPTSIPSNHISHSRSQSHSSDSPQPQSFQQIYPTPPASFFPEGSPPPPPAPSSPITPSLAPSPFRCNSMSPFDDHSRSRLSPTPGSPNLSSFPPLTTAFPPGLIVQEQMKPSFDQDSGFFFFSFLFLFCLSFPFFVFFFKAFHFFFHFFFGPKKLMFFLFKNFF